MSYVKTLLFHLQNLIMFTIPVAKMVLILITTKLFARSREKLYKLVSRLIRTFAEFKPRMDDARIHKIFEPVSGAFVLA